MLAFRWRRVLIRPQSQTAQLGTFTAAFAAVIHHRYLNKNKIKMFWMKMDLEFKKKKKMEIDLERAAV